jgi:hypothetical protein
MPVLVYGIKEKADGITIEQSITSALTLKQLIYALER